MIAVIRNGHPENCMTSRRWNPLGLWLLIWITYVPLANLKGSYTLWKWGFSGRILDGAQLCKQSRFQIIYVYIYNILIPEMYKTKLGSPSLSSATYWK